MRLGELGAIVYVGPRDPARGERAAAELGDRGVDAQFLALDVTDEETVDLATNSNESTGREC